MKPRFEPDSDSGSGLQSSRLIDPEAYDASEQEFAASLDRKSAPRFVVEPPENLRHAGDEPDAADSQVENAGVSSGVALPAPERFAETPVGTQSDPAGEPPTDSWRQEVAARVNGYRARRRPRAPRYPSLLLKFDFPESVEEKPCLTSGAKARNENEAGIAALKRSATQNQSLSAGHEVAPTGRGNQARALAPEVLRAGTDDEPGFSAAMASSPVVESSALVESSARILEFPRSALASPPVLDELAEPMFDRPRILDVPELLLPPPALGGISFEPGEQPETGKRRGFELPLQPAPRGRRLLAAFIDVMLVLAAFAVFAAIFFKITSIVPPLRTAVEFSLIFMGVLWAAYQYGLLVYCGTTPGLRAARLRLSEFDGSPVPRRLRRWRVIASILSGASLALGYAWYFLDEDHLCWHDRITHTYMAPQ
jgi:uncharacterized RDD family membrane protein YckC